MRFEIPEGELAWFFDTSGGPGGQHANRNATRVELRFSIVDSDAFADDVRDRLVDALGAEVRIIEDGTRSQSTNRTKARRRLDRML
ncbi:MAG: aminoacyl-tRNA hydrolase, partial [Acidimicrobiia bacterium]|nr:aminoacyl-tRNA hydrolase [Acidimicrobiia bacterium]